MQRIEVRRSIDAPIDRVFDLVSDHEGYARLNGIDEARLRQAGSSEKNGLGAVREIKAGPIRFAEEITAFERPTRMDYKIIECTIPIEHEGGSVRLVERDGRTEVTWTSTFTVRVPLIGHLLAIPLKSQLTRGFAGALKAWDQRLTGG